MAPWRVAAAGLRPPSAGTIPLQAGAVQQAAAARLLRLQRTSHRYTMPDSAPTLSDSVAPPKRRLLTSLAIGFGAGLLNALVGVGGGILIVPGLVIVRNLDPRVAVATSLGSVLLLSGVALVLHLLISPFALSLSGTALLLAAGAAGSQIGGALLQRVQTRWILFAFSGLTLLSALHLLAIGLDLLPPLVSHVAEPPLWAYGALGLMGGFFSGLLGVGGGGLVVLGLSVIFHTPVFAGLPIAQAVNTANSFSGVAAQWRSRLVLWREVLALVPSGLAGVAVGQTLALHLSADILRIVFAAFFIFMSASLIRKGLRLSRRP
ncbi:MAG: sulfite exporter TauE/SafE family protein [SAR324 cluster bacterium]